jgi:predicted lipoprotein with Yx(FWY)xxD motif
VSGEVTTMTSNATRHGVLVGVVAVIGAALLAACGSTSGASPASSSSDGAALSVIQDGSTSVLADASGHAIYLLTSDPSGASTCNGACATAWPPMPAGSTTVPSGVTASLGTTTRSDGSSQLTVDGHPVYTFQGDSAPDTVTGEGITSFGGTWYALSPSGAEVTSLAAAPATGGATNSAPATSSGGPYKY